MPLGATGKSILERKTSLSRFAGGGGGGGGGGLFYNVLKCVFLHPFFHKHHPGVCTLEIVLLFRRFEHYFPKSLKFTGFKTVPQLSYLIESLRNENT